MRNIYKIIIVVLILENYCSAQKSGQHEKLSGLQVFISPKSEKQSKQRSMTEDNVADIKSKSIQLEISSGDKIENRLDLIIAATKEVQVTPEPDRYSPKYNAATDIKVDAHSKSPKAEASSNYFGPSQRNSGSLFSSEEQADMFPFPVMRSLLPPSLFPLVSHISPMPNIGNFNGNYEPNFLSNSMRNVNRDTPLDLSLLPSYPNSMSQNLAVDPHLHSNSYSLEGLSQDFNQQHRPNSAAVRSPQNFQIIQTAPMQVYPHPTPLMAPVGDLHQAYYRNVDQKPNSALPDSYLRNAPRQERLFHQLDPHAFQGTHDNYPRNHFHPQMQQLNQNTHGHSIPQAGSYIQTHPSTGPRVPQNLSQLELLQELQKSLQPLAERNIQHNQVRHIPPLTEHQDRNRLYAPLQQNSALTKTENDARKENDHYIRQVMPAHQNYRAINMLHDKPIMPSHAKPLTNTPTYHRQRPQYTLVPPESLPRYLKEQQHHQQHPISNQHQLTLDDLRSHSQSNSDEHQSQSPEDRSPHYHNRLPADLIARDHQKRYHTPQKLPTATNYADNIRSTQSNPGLRTNVPEIQQHYPHRNVHSGPSYEKSSNQDSDEGTGLSSGSASNHAMHSRGRPTYELSEIDLNNLPRKKYLKKGRKRMKSQDELEGHASHQFVIKIR